jgi:hypothetical protein
MIRILPKVFIFTISTSILSGCTAIAAQDSIDEINIPIQATFKNKIVYSITEAVEKSILENDCLQKGGRFNECGSVCDDTKLGGCIMMCALTCEFKLISEAQAIDLAKKFLKEANLDWGESTNVRHTGGITVLGNHPFRVDFGKDQRGVPRHIGVHPETGEASFPFRR